MRGQVTPPWLMNARYRVTREAIRGALHAQSVALHIPGIDMLFVLSWFGDGQQRLLEEMRLANQLMPSGGNQSVAVSQILHEFGRQLSKAEPTASFTAPADRRVCCAVNAHLAVHAVQGLQDRVADAGPHVCQQESVVATGVSSTAFLQQAPRHRDPARAGACLVVEKRRNHGMVGMWHHETRRIPRRLGVQPQRRGNSDRRQCTNRCWLSTLTSRRRHAGAARAMEGSKSLTGTSSAAGGLPALDLLDVPVAAAPGRTDRYSRNCGGSPHAAVGTKTSDRRMR